MSEFPYPPMVMENWIGAKTLSFFFAGGISVSSTDGKQKTEDFYQRPNSSLFCLHFQPWQPKVKKRWPLSLRQSVVRYHLHLFCVFLINFHVPAFPSVSRSSRSFESANLVVSGYFFIFFLSQQTKAKEECLRQHCWRFKSFIGERLAKFLPENVKFFSEFVQSMPAVLLKSKFQMRLVLVVFSS